MLTGVAAFLLLLIALLAIPVVLSFRLSYRQTFEGGVELVWAFGLVRVRIPVSRPEEPSPDDEMPGKKAGRSRRPSRKKPRKKTNVIAAVRRQTFRRRIIKFIRDMWRALQKKDLSLRVRLGLDDPADTGQLWAIVGPVSGMLANIREASITIEPDFFDARFELDGSGSIRLVPLQLIYLTIALLLSPPIWQGIKEMGTAR